jgi:pimeloyl-ACP methyl ester carboxylesterase
MATLLKSTILMALVVAAPAAETDAPLKFSSEKLDVWQGRSRHLFEVAGKTAWVAVPEHPQPGKPWIWVTEFPGAFAARTGVPQLFAKGIYQAHVSDFNRLGCDEQLKVMDAFYNVMRDNGFAEKPVLVGISRGGIMAYRWAARNPDKVAGIYGDAPVCDLKSWPGGFGKGKGSPKDWEQAKKLYGWKDDEEGKKFDGNAVDDKPLEILAKAKIPLFHVVGDADDIVPVAENTAIMAEKYPKLGGQITVISHKAGHHPHGLDDPQPTVDFILKCLNAPKP